MDNVEENYYRDLISSLRNNPDVLSNIVKIIDMKKSKLLLTISSVQSKDELWDLKTKISALEDLKKEIVTHSKNQ